MSQTALPTPAQRLAHQSPTVIHPVERGVIAEQSTLLITSPSADARRSLLYPLRVGRFTYGAQFQLERQRFDSFLLGIVTQGTLHSSIWEGDRIHTYEIPAGSAFLFDTYCHHAASTNVITKTSMIHFDGIPARIYYTRIVATSGNVFPLHNSAVFENAIDHLIALYTSEKPNVDLIAANTLTELLTTIALRQTTSEDDNAQAVAETIRFLDGHYMEDLSVDALARRAMLSQRQYLRIFKAVTGTTPHAYIVAHRLNEAKRLLSTSSMPVQAVARAVGYTNLNTFTVIFKNKTEITPTEFRRTAQLGTPVRSGTNI